MSKKDTLTSIKDLRSEQEELKRKLKKIQVGCSHTNEKGNLKVSIIRNNTVRCKKCECVFNFGVVPEDEAENAIETVHNMINQIKAMTNNPVKEASVIKQLGSIDFNLSEVLELYKRTIDQYSKGKNKKKKHGGKKDSFGSYGMNSVSFFNK